MIIANITLSNLSNTTFCAGGAGTISFSPVIAGHNYAVQISDSNGSFGTSPTIIGTSQNGSMTFTTPTGYNSGTTGNYVLRVVDLDDIANVSAPSAVIYFNGLTASVETSLGKINSIYVCSGSSIKLLTKLNQPDNNDVTYEWKKDGTIIGVTTSTYTTNQVGTYQVKATKTGCGISNLSNFTISNNSNLFNEFYPQPNSYQCAGRTLALKSYYEVENATYEWRKNGVLISGQTGTTFSITETGLYSLKITDANCSSTSNSVSGTFTFSNVIPTRINVNADTVVACPNNYYYLSHEGGSNSEYTYQWKKDGFDIPTEKNYYILAVSEGTYSLKIAQGSCSSVSQNVYLKRNGVSSKIIFAYYGTKACVGNSVNLQLRGLICGSFQWQKDGVDITNSGTNYYYSATQTGDYRLKINENGVISYSNVIPVTISNNPDYILTNSNEGVTNCGAYASYYLSNAASGNTYEWYKDNVVINGAISNGYSTYNQGVYKLKITNGACVGYSQDVTVINSSQISKPIMTSSVGKLLCGNTYTNLQVSYYPFYNSSVWKKNGQLIANAVNTYSINITESGSYTYTVTQGSCTATSDPLIINIGDKQQSIKTFNWNDASTWSCGSVPVVTEDILINKGHTVTIPNNYTGFMKDLQLNGSLNYGTNALLKSRTN